jgi:hypothetical protein
MVEMIVFALVVVVLAVKLWEPDDLAERIFGVLMSAMSLGLALLLGIGLAAFIGFVLPMRMDEVPSHTAALVDLTTVDGFSGSVHGSVFMVSGVIGTEQFYRWYEQAGSAVTPRQMTVGVGVYVYEQKRADAVLEVYDWHFAQRWWSWFAFDNNSGKTYRFYVPEGTVKRGFKL